MVRLVDKAQEFPCLWLALNKKMPGQNIKVVRPTPMYTHDASRNGDKLAWVLPAAAAPDVAGFILVAGQKCLKR